MKKTGPIMDLRGFIPYDGPPVSIEEMNQAVLDGVSDDWDRFERQVKADRVDEAAKGVKMPAPPV